MVTVYFVGIAFHCIALSLILSRTHCLQTVWQITRGPSGIAAHVRSRNLHLPLPALKIRLLPTRWRLGRLRAGIPSMQADGILQTRSKHGKLPFHLAPLDFDISPSKLRLLSSEQLGRQQRLPSSVRSNLRRGPASDSTIFSTCPVPS